MARLQWRREKTTVVTEADHVRLEATLRFWASCSRAAIVQSEQLLEEIEKRAGAEERTGYNQED